MKTTLFALLAVFALSHSVSFADDSATASPDMTKDSTTKTENADGTTTTTKKHMHKRGGKMMKKKTETTAPSEGAPASDAPASDDQAK
ncbi:MAG: hypothetical protein ACXVB9_21090 [Bdellovibrionota bacterium]